MESSAAASVALPPQAVAMQMAMGAILSNVVHQATYLNIPDLLKSNGPMTASEIISKGGFEAEPSALQRVLRACASAGVFTEDAAGRFGPTELSDVLTADSP